MSLQPEAQFWKTLKKNLPKNWFVNRIENRIGGGVPDVYICIDGYSIWLELKVTKTHRVSVSPHQIAWHYSLSQSKGTSFTWLRPSHPRTYICLTGPMVGG